MINARDHVWLLLVLVFAACATATPAANAPAPPGSADLAADLTPYIGKFAFRGASGVDFEIVADPQSNLGLKIASYIYTPPRGDPLGETPRDFSKSIRLERDEQGLQIVGPTFRIVKLVPYRDKGLTGDVEIRGSIVNWNVFYWREKK